MSKLPALQFYVGDWRKDPGVQALDYEYRGIWFEILLLMHESEQRGKLLLNGNTMPDEALARLLGLDIQKLKKVKSTLLDFGVASIDEDTEALICRRMVRDEEVRKKRAEGGKKGAEYGKLGGRPSKNPLKTPSDNKGGVNKKPLKNPPSSSSSSSSSSSNKDNTYTAQFEKFWELYGNKKGKKRAWMKWKSLSNRDRQAILDHIPIFKTHYSPSYLPYPKTYLYNRYWEDDDFQKPITSNRNGPKNQQPDENRTERFIRRGQEVLEEYPDENAQSDSG